MELSEIEKGGFILVHRKNKIVMNRENLKQLADYLLTGNLKAGFDMGRFADPSAQIKLEGLNCGTVGCAVGHGPYAGIKKYPKENWLAYSERVFGIPYRENEWQWMFSGLWKCTDNTPEGAGKRINWFLEYGLPENWLEQMNGKTKLCYL